MACRLQPKGFHADGYTVLKGALPAELVERCCAAALSRFAECNEHIKARPLLTLGVGKQAGFGEIVQRQANRFEMRYGMGMVQHPRVALPAVEGDTCTTTTTPNDHEDGEAALRELREIVLGEHVQGVVAGCLSGAAATDLAVPVLDASSCLISLPGCEKQHWHSDGPHARADVHLPAHLINVFVPLVDMSVDLVGTKIEPGSHYHTRDLARLRQEATEMQTLREPLVRFWWPPCRSPHTTPHHTAGQSTRLRATD